MACPPRPGCLARAFRVPGAVTRIFSDVHFGDRLSQVRSFAQLRPLCAGAGALVLNGDTVDSRPGPDPAHTARCLAAAREFAAGTGVPVTFVTGNHDPDFSPVHSLDLAGGRIFVVHGDVLFSNIVPWGRDAVRIGRDLDAELAALPAEGRERLEDRLAAYRRVAAGIRQRHQSERRPVRYLLRLATDTLLPPGSAFGMLRAWGTLPRRAAELARRHRPGARFIVVGHTHRPGVWSDRSGVGVVNTGSFTRPFGAFAVDVEEARLTVRRIERRGGDFHPGRELARFSL
jgi:predicted phosphodiesterase